MRAGRATILWRKAPFLLRVFPQIFGIVLLSAAILAVSSSSGGVFLKASESASIAQEIEGVTRWAAGYRVQENGSFELAFLPPRERMALLQGMGTDVSAFLAERTSSILHLDEVSTTFLGTITAAVSEDGELHKSIRLIHRDGALDHVVKVDRAAEGGDGLWLPDVTAEQLGLSAGDDVTLSGARDVVVKIAGTYRFLPLDRPRDFWAGLGEFINRGTSDEFYPPAFAIYQGEGYFETAIRLGDIPDIRWEIPLEADTYSMDEVTTLASDFTKLSRGIRREVASGRLEGIHMYFLDTATLINNVRASAAERIDTLTPVVGLLAIAGGLVSLGVMMAAGYYLVRRRIVEVRTLSARGLGPLTQGVRYCLEAIVPAAVGSLAGMYAGFFVIRWIGPSQGIPLSVASSDLGRVALTVAAGLLVLGLGAAIAVRRAEKEIAEEGDVATEHRVLILAGAFAALGGGLAFQLRDHVSADTESLRDPTAMSVPIFLILCASIVGAMVLRFVLPRFGRSLREKSPSLFLASQRLAGAPGMTQVLVTAGACALGVMIYGLTLGSSVGATAEAKAKLFVGSDFAAQIASMEQPQGLSFPSTIVRRADHVATGPQDLRVNFVSIDLSTFDGAAYWDRTFADIPLDQLLDELAWDGDGPIPVAVIGGDPQITSLDGAGESVSVTVAEYLDAFPGVSRNEIAVVAASDGFSATMHLIGGSVSPPSQELWAAGEPGAIERELLAHDINLQRTVDTAVVLDTPGLQSLRWTLNVLGALGAAAGLIAMLGLLLYLQARHRSTVVASAMTRRMGLSRRGEFMTSLAEILGAAMISLMVAAGAGIAVASLINARLDLRPTLPPAPLLVVPALAIALTVVAVIVGSFISAWRVQRSIDRADIAQILRT